MIKDSLNRPLQDLRISVTDRCNFRCDYCMPKDREYTFLPRDELLSFEEIVRLANIFAQLGVSKIRITGGEPLLRSGLADLVGMLANIPGIKDLALTSNGYLLPRYAQALRQAGLKRVTVSLDTLDAHLFKQMSGSNYHPEDVIKGIDAARQQGLLVKVNMLVQKGVNEHHIQAMADWARKQGIILRFIEFMDVGNINGWDSANVFTRKQILEVIEPKLPFQAAPANYPGEVAQRFFYKDGLGEFGIISSISHTFCKECSRVRLSSKGELFNCLFASQGFDLKKLLRAGISEQKLKQLLRAQWHKRDDRYSELRNQLSKRPISNSNRNENRIEMYQIGG